MTRGRSLIVTSKNSYRDPVSRQSVTRPAKMAMSTNRFKSLPKTETEDMNNRALNDYMRMKSKLIKRRRVFDDNKIATLDEETESRTSLVARLLGGSKEARSI